MSHSRLRPFGFLFEKSLKDLIRGIRARKSADGVQAYIREVIAECREEVRSPDLDTKTTAILKLAYLEMFGYDMSWAGFHVLEVMASPGFQQKRIGYIAAMQSFGGDAELLMLSTNLLKTDLASSDSGLPRVSVALSGIATMVTPLLAADVVDDILRMLTHSSPYIRKKAVIAMHKVCLKYPQSLDEVLPRIGEKLEDEDSSVVGAAVSVIGEFCYHTNDIRRFVELAPQLYELLLSSHNNWTIIKLLKLFARFSLAEPRLRTRLLPAVRSLMDTSPATSLTYECVACILQGQFLSPDNSELASAVVSKIRLLIEENDQNLKFVGLLALGELADINPEFIESTEFLVLGNLQDPDPVIRQRVLGMLPHVVNDDNLEDIVMKLMDKPEVSSIIELCSINQYAYLPNFEWYADILQQLAQRTYFDHNAGKLIGAQIMDIAIRVRSARSQIIEVAAGLALDRRLSTQQPELLNSCLWVLGEYIDSYITSLNVETIPVLVSHLTALSVVSPALVVALAKIFLHYTRLSENIDGMKNLLQQVLKGMESFYGSRDLEVRERASEFCELFRLGSESFDQTDEVPPFISEGMTGLFSGNIVPVAPNTQRRIQLPTDVDWETPVEYELNADLSASEPEPESEPEPGRETDAYEQSGGATEREEQQRRPYYISSSPALESREVSIKSEPLQESKAKKRIQKVKVEIAADVDPIGDNVSPEPISAEPVSERRSLFQSGFQTSNGVLDPRSPEEPVVVRHKKKKKHSHKHKHQKNPEVN